MALKPHKINELGNFVAGWYLDDPSLCDELVRHHGASQHKRAGSTAGDQSKPDSTTVLLTQSSLAARYAGVLHEMAREYTVMYPWCMKMVPWGIIEPVGIVHYQPGAGKHQWHFERDNTTEVVTRRHLAFMTFLNDVHDGGGIEFHHHNLVFKPERGLTLIWPSDWTFTYRELPAPTEYKYIAAGWYSTYTPEQYNKVAR